MTEIVARALRTTTQDLLGFAPDARASRAGAPRTTRRSNAVRNAHLPLPARPPAGAQQALPGKPFVRVEPARLEATKLGSCAWFTVAGQGHPHAGVRGRRDGRGHHHGGTRAGARAGQGGREDTVPPVTRCRAPTAAVERKIRYLLHLLLYDYMIIICIIIDVIYLLR